jgi:hypothetical protein
MKRLIIYIIKHSDGSFAIENGIWDEKVTENNIQNYLGKIEENILFEKRKRINDKSVPDYHLKVRADLISIINLEE